MSARTTAIAGMVLLAALLPVAPLGLGFDRLASDLYLAAAAVGLGIVVGLGGMPSLGQGAFIALGAFATAVLETKAGWPTEAAVLAGVVLAALAGGVVGTVAGRLRPALVAVFTWLLAWLVAIGLTAFPSISGGAQGIAVEQGSIAGIELSATVLRARRRTDGARRSALLGAPAKPRGSRALGRPPAPSGRGSSRGPGGPSACRDLRARCRACGGGRRPRCPSRPGGRCRSVRAVALGEALHRRRARRSRRSRGRARRRSGARAARPSGRARRAGRPAGGPTGDAARRADRRRRRRRGRAGPPPRSPTGGVSAGAPGPLRRHPPGAGRGRLPLRSPSRREG